MSEPRQIRRRIPFYLYYALSFAGGVYLLLHLVENHMPARVDWIGVAAFFVVLLFADTKLAETQVRQGGRVLSSRTLDLSMMVLFGPAVAVIVEVASTILRGFFLRRAAPRKVIFNVSMLILAAGLAGQTYVSMPWHDRLDGPLFLVPLLVALLVYTLVNTAMMTAIISFDRGVPFREVWRSHFSWGALRGLTEFPFAAMVVLLYAQAGAWTLLIYLFPIFVIFQSVKLFQEMKEAHINSIAALTTTLEANEPYTHGHSYRVSKYCVRLGRAMGLSPQELETMEYGGLLHDIGKIAITNDIICKPGRLTEEEFGKLTAHPAIGAEIVKQIKFLQQTADLVRHHHERPDGKGYPDGLKGDDISIGAGIMNVCDAFDAMTSDRSYRKALPVEKAVEELVRFRGTQFNAAVVDTLVSLYNRGEFGVITDIEGMMLEIQRVPGTPATVPAPAVRS